MPSATKSALTKLGSTRVVLPFLGREQRKERKTAGQCEADARHASKFRDDKAKIKAQMKEVRKAIVLEKKNSSKKS